MKTQTILSLKVEGDTKANLDETARAVGGLQVKYSPDGDRAYTPPDLLSVVEKVLRGSEAAKLSARAPISYIEAQFTSDNPITGQSTQSSGKRSCE